MIPNALLYKSFRAQLWWQSRTCFQLIQHHSLTIFPLDVTCRLPVLTLSLSLNPPSGLLKDTFGSSSSLHLRMRQSDIADNQMWTPLPEPRLEEELQC